MYIVIVNKFIGYKPQKSNVMTDDTVYGPFADIHAAAKWVKNYPTNDDTNSVTMYPLFPV